MLKTVLRFVILLLLCSGCAKDDDGAACPEDFSGALQEEEKVLPSVWVLSAVEGTVAIDLTDDQTDNPDTDLFAQLGQCEQNARYIFKEDRSASYYASEQENLDCTEKILFDGTWKLENEVLYLNAGCFNMQAALTFDELFMTFSFAVEEIVRDYRDKEVNMVVTYFFTRQ